MAEPGREDEMLLINLSQKGMSTHLTSWCCIFSRQRTMWYYVCLAIVMLLLT